MCAFETRRQSIPIYPLFPLIVVRLETHPCRHFTHFPFCDSISRTPFTFYLTPHNHQCHHQKNNPFHPQEIRNFRTEIHRVVSHFPLAYDFSSSIRKMTIFLSSRAFLFLWSVAHTTLSQRSRGDENGRKANRLCDMKMVIEIRNLPRSYFLRLNVLSSTFSYPLT